MYLFLLSDSSTVQPGAGGCSQSQSCTQSSELLGKHPGDGKVRFIQFIMLNLSEWMFSDHVLDWSNTLVSHNTSRSVINKISPFLPSAVRLCCVVCTLCSCLHVLCSLSLSLPSALFLHLVKHFVTSVFFKCHIKNVYLLLVSLQAHHSLPERQAESPGMFRDRKRSQGQWLILLVQFYVSNLNDFNTLSISDD